jgi:hypothetical protein
MSSCSNGITLSRARAAIRHTYTGLGYSARWARFLVVMLVAEVRTCR